MIYRKTVRNISCKAMTKILYRNSEKSFLKKHLPALFPREFFMFVLLISNHTVFLVQFEINLHLRVFQKAEIALAKAACAISRLFETHSCKLILN